jgi:O-antigen/teichoic acid export membrane protein
LLTSGSYISTGLNLITAIIVTRSLGPADYGVVALAMAYPSLVWSFVGIKSVSVTIRYIAGFRAREEWKELLGVVKLGYGLDFLVSAICFLLVGLTAWWVSLYLYHIPHLEWLMAIYAFSFPFYSTAGTSRAILSSWQRFDLLAFFNVLEVSIKLILSAALLFLGFGAVGVIAANSLGHIIIGISMAVTATCLLRKEGIGLWWHGSMSQMGLLRRELTGFLGWNYLLVTLNGFIEQLPLMLLGTFRGSEETGYYRLATNIKNIGSAFEGSMGGVVYPALSARWASGERETLNRSIKRWMLRGGLPASILEALLIPFLPFAVPFAFGDGYKPAVLGMQILIGAAALRAPFFWLSSFYYASGKISLWVMGNILYMLLLVGLGWAAIPYGGFLGMVLVSALTGLVFTFTMAGLALRREFSLS